ncbi:uncharacterized protein LOC142342667 isoform X2 [Convolutriloba macropyga]|uniref:uncharacterized protein LOC142342667 isoform X2 n=1 Tax=Convolutriloba macropyga TaxID=536237 RepID=UPI003F522AD7
MSTVIEPWKLMSLLLIMALTWTTLEGSSDPVRKATDCKHGTTKEYFDKQFQMSRKQVDETFDSYCYTEDLTTYKCCLEPWMGGSGSMINNYTVSLVASNNGERPVEWKIYPINDNSVIINNGKCVQFPIPQSGATCKVKLLYSTVGQSEGSQNVNKDQGLSSALYYANFMHPEMPYSIHYHIDKEDGFSSISRADNIVNITVRTPELNRQFSLTADWQLCVCVATTTEVENRQPIHKTQVGLEPTSDADPANVEPLTCSYKSYPHDNTYLIETRNIYDDLPRDRPFDICVAVARELYGSFGYDRLCQHMDFSDEFIIIASKAAITLEGNSVRIDESLLRKIVLVAAAIVGLGLALGLVIKCWRKQRSSTPKEKGSTDQGESGDNHYEEIGYGHSEHYYSYIVANDRPTFPPSDQWRSGPAVGKEVENRDGEDAYGDSGGSEFVSSSQRSTDYYHSEVHSNDRDAVVDGAECYVGSNADIKKSAEEDGNNSADISSGYLSQHSTSSNSSSAPTPNAASLVVELPLSITANENIDDSSEANRLINSDSEESVLSKERIPVTAQNISEVHSSSAIDNDWYGKAALMSQKKMSSDA